MAGYDSSKDVCICRGEAKIGDKEAITVGLYSYNKGEPKLRINRVRAVKGESRYSSAGGMTLKELKVVIPLIKGAVAELSKMTLASEPAVPSIPTVPQVPQVPAAPVIPEVPQVGNDVLSLFN